MKSKLEAWTEIKDLREKFYNCRTREKDKYQILLTRLASDYNFIYGSRFDLNKKPDERD